MNLALGRVPSLPDSRDYRLGDYLPRDVLRWPRRSRLWEFHEHTLDQGQTSHCTGFAACHWRISAPVKERLPNQIGHDTYYAIKRMEGNPDGEGGATMRGLARALVAGGFADTYAFANSVAEVKDYVLNHGPILAGTMWTDDMFEPDANGILHPTGGLAGGHAWLVRGYVRGGYFYGMSSWGEGWGRRGNFYIHERDLEYLMRMYGEFVAVMQVKQ